MTAGERLAEAAETFVGAPFRLHGRDAATGLDCVGLVMGSLASAGRKPLAPSGYSLRNASIAQWLPAAAANGFESVCGRIHAGDVLLVVPGPAQHHLMIAVTGGQVIHAHAGLKRVVRHPLPSPLDPAAHWRLIDSDKDT